MYHFVTSPDKNRDSASICAFFNDEHSIPSCAKFNFTNKSCASKFLCRQILESWNNAPICGNCNQLQISTSHVRINTSISGPPTHLTAGNLFCKSKWFASSSKPHWQITKEAPTSLIF